MSDSHEELLNVYDVNGRVVATRPRREAKASGEPVGAINVLLVRTDGHVLLQRRPDDKENGGRWDKSVGGHVGAGETFDVTAVREAGEERFDDPRSARVKLVERAAVLQAPPEALAQTVVFHAAGVQHNLRDVRLAPDGQVRRVVYHVALYLGRTAVPVEGFRPQPSEIKELRYFSPADVDRMLVANELSPNMSFFWLSRGWELLALAGVAPRARLTDT